jgi:hypothetical protein
LRLLTKSEVVGDYQAPADADELAKQLSKVQRALLNVVARVPPASRHCAASAADWLLSRVTHPKEGEESAQKDHMQELISVVQKAVSQDAAVQAGFTRPCSGDDIVQARAAIVR